MNAPTDDTAYCDCGWPLDDLDYCEACAEGEEYVRPIVDLALPPMPNERAWSSM